MTTLLFGTDDDTRAATASILQARGHDVHTAHDAEMAWTICERARPALLVLLGVGDAARRVSRRVRRASDGSIMIVALLQAADPDRLEAALDAGVDDCIRADGASETLSRQFMFVERRVRKRQERVQTAALSRRRASHQAVVAEISRRALAGTAFDRFMEHAARAVADALDVDACTVLERTGAAEAFAVRAHAGPPPGRPDAAPFLAPALAAYTLQADGPVLVDDVAAEKRFQPAPDWAPRGLVSGACVAIGGADAPFGVLGVYTRTKRSFNADDVHFLQSVANALAGAVERIRAEQALRESEAKARAIVETTVDGVITIDKRGRIESFNQAAESIFGYAAEEVIGKNVKVLMPTPYREEHDGYMRSYRETGRRRIIGIGREVTGRRKDGSTFPMDLAVSEVALGDRRLFTGIVRDITERRRLEKEILDVTEQERRRIGQDLHDGLGQMLTGMGLLSQNLTRQLERRDVPEAEDAAEITDLLKEADQYARDLARGLTPVDLEASGLVAALQRLVANAQRLFDIDCVFDEVGSALVHDGTTATHMYRIAQEAVSNAVRHGEARRIKISLAAGTEQIRLRIQDDGIGFSSDDNDGPGMGVHIMSYRARIVGGTLDISSSPGNGTAVTFTLPRRGLGGAPPADGHARPSDSQADSQADSQTDSQADDARPGGPQTEDAQTPPERHA